MQAGLMGGILWALDTVILGIALSKAPFLSTEKAILLAPFISTFLHDSISSLFMLLYMGAKKQFSNIIKALKTKSGKLIMLGAILGGPIGMTGYVSAIKYIGPSYTAAISAIYPAIGAFLAFAFLKEKMEWYQICGLLVSISGVMLLGYSKTSEVPANFTLGIFCALICVLGWGLEAVICAYAMKKSDINNEQALQIRQVTSAIVYGAIIIPLLKGLSVTVSVISDKTMLIIMAAGLCGTLSYLCYYKAINKIGASKAMALNITYSAWSILFSLIFLGTLPNAKGISCGILIITGSLLSAYKIKEKITINIPLEELSLEDVPFED
ncbi:MAG: DMT family transporter [Oscillospiraceae bacterium]